MIEPTLRQLQYALAVAEHRHFRRAAESCHVTQPALSTQIQQLEELLGVQLFERDRRSVLVTAAGEEILDRARRCLAEMRELGETAVRLRQPGGGPLRLGIIPTMAPYLLPHVLPRLRKDHPDYELRLWEEQTDVLLQRLSTGEIDVAFLALPVDAEGLVETALAEEPFVLLAPEGHRLARRKRLRESDLAGEEVLLLEKGHCLRDQALEVCRLAHAGLASGVHANSLSTLVQLVAAGQGVTLIPASAVPVEVTRQASVITRWFEGEEPSRTLGTLWRKSSARAEEFEGIARTLADVTRRRLARVRPKDPERESR